MFVYLFAAWAGLAGLATLARAEPVFPTGMRIGLEPPAELKLSPRFPGFEDLDRNVSVAILDLPANAYAELEAAAFNKVQQELQEVKRESFPYESGIGFLISGIAQQNGVGLHRWSLLAQAVGASVQNLTMLINVEVPDSALAIYSDAVIRKMLASVVFRQAPIQEQLGLLPFKLGDLSRFRVMQVLPGGGAILADTTADPNAPQPFMIISVGRGAPPEANDRGLFARDLLSTAPVRDLRMQSSEPMRVNGSAGYEIRAQGRAPSGEPVSVVQWLRFGSGGYLRVIGVSPAEKWDQMFDRFRAVRDGIDMH
jgi:hypothetical protein